MVFNLQVWAMVVLGVDVYLHVWVVVGYLVRRENFHMGTMMFVVVGIVMSIGEYIVIHVL